MKRILFIVVLMALVAGVSLAYDPFTLKGGKQASPYSTERGGMFGTDNQSQGGKTYENLSLAGSELSLAGSVLATQQ